MPVRSLLTPCLKISFMYATSQRSCFDECEVRETVADLHVLSIILLKSAGDSKCARARQQASEACMPLVIHPGTPAPRSPDEALCCAVVLVVCGVISSIPTRLMRNYAVFAASWLAVGGIIVFVLLLVTAWPLQPANFVLTAFTRDQKSAMGIPNDV